MHLSLLPVDEQWLPTLEQITDDLVEKGYSVIDQLLPDDVVQEIQDRLLALKDEDQFKKSGIGKLLDHQINSDIRGDYIRWIDTQDLPPYLKQYYHFLEQLASFTNRHLFLSLKDYEGHYTYYPPGKYYLKHRDRFRKNPHRILSAVYYLNQHRSTGDGGELVLYDNDHRTLDTIEPLWNRLAIFKSEMLHEVLPCKTARYSITTWMLDREKELTFL